MLVQRKVTKRKHSRDAIRRAARAGPLRSSRNEGTAHNSLRSNTCASSPLVPLRCSARFTAGKSKAAKQNHWQRQRQEEMQWHPSPTRPARRSASGVRSTRAAVPRKRVALAPFRLRRKGRGQKQQQLQKHPDRQNGGWQPHPRAAQPSPPPGLTCVMARH